MVRTATITVAGANDAPVLASALTGATHEDAAPFIADLLDGATDVDASDVLSATDLVQTGGRAVVLTQTGSTLAIDPGQFNDLAVGETETLTFSFNVFDGTAKVAQVLTVTVEGRNDAPVAVADHLGSKDDYSVLTINPADLLANDHDPDRLDLPQVVSVGNATNGMVLRLDDGTILFQPLLGYSGLASFDYTIADGNGGFATATATVDCRLPDNLIYGSADDDRLKAGKTSMILDGREGDDRLSGKGGNDTLVGGAGDDEMVGNRSDDLFRVQGTDSGFDSFKGQGGTDTILGSIGDDVIGFQKFSRGDSIEVIDGGHGHDVLLIQSGSSADFSATTILNVEVIEGQAGNERIIGSAGDDAIFGHAGDDFLSGGAGDDWLDGGAGDDMLTGGAGADTYVFGRGGDRDRVDNSGQSGAGDRVVFGDGIDSDQLWFRREGRNLAVEIIGTRDKIVVEDWFRGSANRVDWFETRDGDMLLASQVDNLISAMASISPPPVGQLDLSDAQHAKLDPVLAANWQSGQP